MLMRELIVSEAVKLGFIFEGNDQARLLFHSSKDVYLCIHSDEELAEDLKDPDPEKFAIVSIGHGSGYDQEIEPGCMLLSSTGETTPANWLRMVLEDAQPKQR